MLIFRTLMQELTASLCLPAFVPEFQYSNISKRKRVIGSFWITSAGIRLYSHDFRLKMMPEISR
jgi:hypothetical protein